MVEDSQLEEVAEIERVVGDRLLRDEHGIGPASKSRELNAVGPPRKYESLGSSLSDRARVDPEHVLEIGADVGVCVVDAARGGDTRDWAIRRAVDRRALRDDVGAERQFRVDASLLVVGRGEDADLDTERQQEPEQQQAAVQRRAAACRALDEKAAARSRARPEPGGRKRAAAQPEEQQPVPIQSSAGAKNM